MTRLSEAGPITINVALAGATGVGKSTLVNILKGSMVAKANYESGPCTTKATRYEVVEAGTTYCIHDTRGLNEASVQGAISFQSFLKFLRILPDAERELKNLLHGKNPKIDLVLLCVGREKIKVKAPWKTYTKIHVDFCKSGTKVAVVVTRTGDADIGNSQWKETCKEAAKEVVEGSLDGNLMEAVPVFKDLQDQKVKDCRAKILGLISRCR